MYSHLNYIPRSRHMRNQAKKSMGYIETRKGRDRETMERPLFGKGGRLTLDQVTRMIDEAPDNTLFWRMILNPDPVLENPEKLLDLRQLTNDAVRWLENRLGKEGIPRDLPFAAAIHDDHTPLAHVHAVVLMQRQGRERPITPEILDELKAAVSDFALTQVKDRTQAIAIGVSLISEAAMQQEEAAMQQEQVIEAGFEVSGASFEPDASGGAAIDGWGALSCPACAVGTLNRRLNSRVYECGVCGYAQRYGRMIHEGRRKEAGRARSL